MVAENANYLVDVGLNILSIKIYNEKKRIKKYILFFLVDINHIFFYIKDNKL